MPCTHTQHAQHTTTVSQVENIFGGLVDAATYVENIPEGEFSAQANKGATIATNTPVSQVLRPLPLPPLRSCYNLIIPSFLADACRRYLKRLLPAFRKVEAIL
jgi:hypothetical protein